MTDNIGRVEIRAMKKAQLVDYACDFFEDNGNLRQEMEALSKRNLLDLLFENGAGDDYKEPEPEPLPVVSAKPKRGPLDLGS